MSLVEFDPEAHARTGVFWDGRRSFPNCWDGKGNSGGTREFCRIDFRDKVLAEAEVQYAAPRH